MVNVGRKTPRVAKFSERNEQLPDLTPPTKRVPSYWEVILITFLGACASDDGFSSGYYDPLEPTNRAVHAFNKGMDKYALRPVSSAYGAITPDQVENMVENVGDNLGAPADAINGLLQGKFKNSLIMVGRFGVNSTVGVLGLFDPATTFGWEEVQTDFGETLGAWGFPEGAYLELPVLGSSTVRNATGQMVDFFLDPVGNFIKSPESDYVLGAKVLDIVDFRHRYGVAIDPALYGSADSYATLRSAYLQSTRTLLKGQTDEDDLEDPFAFE